MSRRVLIPLASLTALALAVPSVSAAQFEGTITARTTTLEGSALLALIEGNIGQIEEVMNRPIDEIRNAQGAETETAVVKVKGRRAYTTMENGGDVLMDYETGEFTMVDRDKKVYATWTAEELQRMMQGMMPPGAAAGPPSGMARLAARMGGEPPETEGPFPLNRTDRTNNCTWYAVRKGEITFTDSPANPAAMLGGGSLTHGCVSDEYPKALESYRRFTAMSRQMNPMSASEGPDAEELLLEHGLPVIVKTLKRGMMPSSYSLEIEQLTVTEGKVEIPELDETFRKVSMQEFMMGRMNREP